MEERIIDEWIASHREELIRDIGRLVRIRSVSEETEGAHPYGDGCARALEELLDMGGEYGFTIENHSYHCGSITSPGKSGGKTIGLWGHLDVVPEGEGWIYPPYECTEKEGFLIGRGTQDNKGPAVTALYALRCIRELVPAYSCTLQLIGGCSEETGMGDVSWYTKHLPQPDYSLVTDCGFPVCHGEKGICELTLESAPLKGEYTELLGGIASNVVPDRAEAVLSGGTASRWLAGRSVVQGDECECEKGKSGSVEFREESGSVRLTARGFTAHAASPEGGINGISVLCRALMELENEDREIFAFLAEASGCIHGEALEIACQDEASGKLTCVGSLLSLADGRLRLGFNIRYPVTADAEKLADQAKKVSAAHGFTCTVTSDDKPNYVEKDTPFVRALMKVYHQVTGSDRQPYVMGGGTYARKLANAVGFGPGEEMDLSPLKLPAGHGSCHAPDEAQSVEGLLRALKIYVLALLELEKL